ncbi:MAG TPA: tyrosine-type recombinase/integrase [Acidimicrobiia bacterium]
MGGTARGRRAHWAEFVQWCAALGEPALPATPDAVVDYLVELPRTSGAAGVEARVAAIGDAHREVGLPVPTDDARVRIEVTRARWRRRPTAPRAVPLAARELGAMVAALPGGLAGVRDHALLLVGVGAGLRSSELVALDVSDLVVVDGGLSVARLRGRLVVPYAEAAELCAARAWQRWVAAAGLTAGPAFRAVDRHGRLGLQRLSERSVTRIVRRAAARAGLEEPRDGARSLRLDAPA